MLKNYTITLFMMLIFSVYASAQFADIRGIVWNGEEVSATAFVQLKKGAATVAKQNVTENGEFIFSELSPGDYTLLVNVIGAKSHSEAIQLQYGESIYRKIVVNGTSVLGEATARVVKIKEEPMILTGVSMTQNPFEGILDNLSMNTGITNRGGVIQGSSARQGQLAIIKNGQTQLGPIAPTMFNMGQARVLTAGIPVAYGDFIGGAIEYSTTDVLDTLKQSNFMVRTSSPFNAFHHNAFEGFWYKPIKVVEGETKLAWSQSVFADYKKDPDPTVIQLYKITPQAKADLLNAPFNSSETGLELPAPNSFTSNNLETTKAKANVGAYNVYAASKLSWKPSTNSIVRVEPSLQYVSNKTYSFSNSLLNYDHNPLNSSIIGKVNAEILHTLIKPFNKQGKLLYDSALLSKLNYVINFDYQRVNSSTEDPVHRNQIFNYGHVGAYTRGVQDAYTYTNETVTVTDQNGEEQVISGFYKYNGFADTSLTFVGDPQNAQRATVTQYIITRDDINNLGQLSQAQGLLNGQNPVAINGMWYAPGTVISNYSKSDEQKTSINAVINMAVHPKRTFALQHDVQIGTLFEQRKRSYYSLEANGLWQIMPQLLNRQFGLLDTDNPILSYDSKGMFTDTVRYAYNEDLSRQTQFDKNLRAMVDQSNGFHTSGAHYIDVNSIDPGLLSIDMFSADELWNNGSSYVQYAGYDYKGKLQRKPFRIDDFLNDKANRYIDAYRPNYTALWLQDKFVLEKIKIRAGVRIERFDANQRVLRDPYSLYPIKTIAEVAQFRGSPMAHPSNLPSEAAVYVNDVNTPTAIVGYRSGNTWYDERGNQVSSPEYLRSQTTAGVIQPYLVNPNSQRISNASFEDYTPQIIVLPRLSFSFPVTTTGLFYAYYDKFAQRPNFAQSFAPISSYYYLENASTTVLANPALKPARRTDYELGYKQVIGLYSQLNLKVGYAEVKDDINLISVEQAYPRSYITYANNDFSTIKSFGAEYVLGTKTTGLTVSYLLQFADGTGSNANSAATLVQLNQPNLRSLYPLDYDVRHKLNGSFTYSFNKQDFKKNSFWHLMSIGLFARTQSGSPYTAIATAIPEAQNLGTSSRSQIKGNPFGSRMPWNYSLDLSVSKTVALGKQPFVFQLNALNVLNIMNVYSVYPYSSSATDDGYLASPLGQQKVRNELNAQSFVNYYNLKQNNPNNFGNPRMISLTIRTSI